MAYSWGQPSGYYYQYQQHPKLPMTVAEADSFVGEIVLELQSYLRQETGITVTEIVKGGSLGQGTAIPGSFDLDLVLYSQGIKANDVLHRGVRTILEMLNAFLSRHFGSRYTSLGLTEHAVRFSLTHEERQGSIDVDLLPSPYWMHAVELHSYLMGLSTDAQRRKFSCSAAKWQKEFILSQPPQVKEYIKRAKAWRNNVWPTKQKGSGRPKSYLIGLLVTEAYQQTQWQRTDYAITEKMKELVICHDRLRIHWTNRGAAYNQLYTIVFPTRGPYIIDPANPFNNVYITGIGHYDTGSPEGTYENGDGDWSLFIGNISSLDLSQSAA